MEKRVFGCKEFSDEIFTIALSLLEKIMDHLLEDRVGSSQSENQKTYRIGIYANER